MEFGKKEANYEYLTLSHDLIWHRSRLLNMPERFQPIISRKDITVMDVPQMKGIFKGKYLSQYRGFLMLKSSLDMSTYSQMFEEIQPKSIIELGTFIGSSVLWMDDILRLTGIDCKIFTLDNDVALRDKRIDKLVSEKVTFMEGDVNNIENVFPPSFFKDLPRPLFVIEDVHHNLDGILKHFHTYLDTGDYFIIEDTNPMISEHMYVGEQDPSIYREGSSVKPEYTQFGNWKLNIVREFFTKHVESYAVDTFFTDLFGENASSQMNSILRKMK